MIIRSGKLFQVMSLTVNSTSMAAFSGTMDIGYIKNNNENVTKYLSTCTTVARRKHKENTFPLAGMHFTSP